MCRWLEDGNGNEIRVKEVRDNSNITDVYQGGFVTDPYIHFQSVNPVTGAVVSSSYNIPPGTNVRIMCGEEGNLESLPTDAFMRWKTHSMSEVQAGVLLQDGTRKMTADFDLDRCIETMEEITKVKNIGTKICGICVKACRGRPARKSSSA